MSSKVKKNIVQVCLESRCISVNARIFYVCQILYCRHEAESRSDAARFIAAPQPDSARGTGTTERAAARTHGREEDSAGGLSAGDPGLGRRLAARRKARTNECNVGGMDVINGSFRVRSTNFLLNLRDPPPISMKFGTLADNA